MHDDRGCGTLKLACVFPAARSSEGLRPCQAAACGSNVQVGLDFGVWPAVSCCVSPACAPFVTSR